MYPKSMVWLFGANSLRKDTLFILDTGERVLVLPQVIGSTSLTPIGSFTLSEKKMGVGREKVENRRRGEKGNWDWYVKERKII